MIAIAEKTEFDKNIIYTFLKQTESYNISAYN